MNLLSFIGPQELIIVLLVVIVIPVFLIIPIIALVDILKNEFTGNNKLIWVLVILLSWIIGAILYFFIGRKQKIQN
ncbi:MAG: PLD nuclease N-terminal domain-containing protein [Draconibacterium sp.]|nr:PLD nuclease N-terminal domain-containing protein [Draconibacterium sp.]